MVNTPASRIKARSPFPCAFYSGKQLNCFQDIPFAKQYWNRFNFAHFQIVGAHFRGRDVFIRPVGGYHHLSNFDEIRRKGKVYYPIFVKRHRVNHCVKAYKLDHEGVFSLRYRKRVKTICVRGGANGFQLFDKYRSTNKCLPGFGVLDRSAKELRLVCAAKVFDVQMERKEARKSGTRNDFIVAYNVRLYNVSPVLEIVTKFLLHFKSVELLHLFTFCEPYLNLGIANAKLMPVVEIFLSEQS